MLTQLFTSRTRINLLLKLFLNPEVSCYLRELSKEFSLSPNALKEELDNLSEAGYLDCERNGRKINYKANTKHPFFPEIHSIVRKTFGIDKIIDQILSKLGTLEAVYILDDYAEGKDSGLIDLLIVGEVNKEKLERLVKTVEIRIKRIVRFLVVSPDAFVDCKGVLFSRPHWKLI